jgi:carboxypeptidase C (cathepsin A)
MYVPELADQILQNQDTIIDGGKLNFQGMLIGNGAMNLDLYWRTYVTLKHF